MCITTQVYDLLKEQADALRAAKQAALQQKLAAAKREVRACVCVYLCVLVHFTFSGWVGGGLR